jgi:hypothetical protein
MFSKTEVRNSTGDLLTLQLGDTSSGIYIQEFTGLDPVKASIVSSAFANHDGSVYQSSRRDNRNITIKLSLDPDPAVSTVRSLRQQLYNFFMTKQMVTLKFFVDEIDDISEDGYQIVGRVESFASAMFAQEPIVDISIICFDPDFIDPVTVVLPGTTTAGTTPTHITYPGTSPAGMLLSIEFDRTCSAVTVYSGAPGMPTGAMNITIPGGFLAGDIMTFSSNPGDKGAWLVRDGGSSPALYAIDPQAYWPVLYPGDNTLRVYASGAAIPTNVSYNVRYGGL